MDVPKHLCGLRPEDLEELALDAGEKSFRGRQLFEQVHARLVRDLDDMHPLPAGFRRYLAEQGWTASALEPGALQASADGTIKLGLATHDGAVIETVLIGMDNGTHTQCLSSQVGCALKCAVCMTGTLGFTRNLTAGEIVDQHLFAMTRYPDMKIRNLVFMGMGEPLLNFEELSRAVSLLQEARGRNISYRRITVSTAGVVPGIDRMGRELHALLAVSLNAPDQELREQLMPVARKYPLDHLMASLKRFPLPPRQRITLEYVLIRDCNDTAGHAHRLVKLVSNIRCKVNLIPFNPFPGCDLRPPTEDSVDSFLQILADKKLTATVRRSKGADIQAACGQLAGLQPGPEQSD